jgi:hypothetical protein
MRRSITMDTSRIQEHMKVVGSDRQPVGTVDHVVDDRIKLARNDPEAGGEHHYIPADWVEAVEDGQVRLSCSAHDARAQWQTAH